MARILPLVLILCAACHSPAPQVITATIPAPTPTPSAPPAAQAPALTVVGTAQLDVQPDTADLHVTLSATAARPGEAVKVVRARQAQLDAKFAPIGLAPGDIRLSQRCTVRERARASSHYAGRWRRTDRISDAPCRPTLRAHDPVNDLIDAANASVGDGFVMRTSP